jgi:hypothetical protein
MSDHAFGSAGWWGYFLCASVYVLGALKTGDIIGLVGSLFFLLATLCFMVPHYRNRPRLKTD